MIREHVGIIFMNDKGEILLQHRDENAQRYPNCWGFFGGGIEEGETPEIALRREIKEELGIRLKSYKFFKKYELKDVEGDIREYFYIASFNTSVEDLKKNLNLKEGKDLKYFSLEEIRELNTPDYEKPVFDDFQISLNSKVKK